MSLPKDLLAKRLKNELKECKRSLQHFITISDPNFEKFPVEIMVTIVNTPGPVWEGGKIRTKYTHKLKVIITDEYPFQTPIIRWRSKIFHPNIMLPGDGGYVCTRLLDDWNFNSTLISFFKGLESLLGSPNPDNPYESDSCTRAAEYFNKNDYSPPDITPQRVKPVIVSEEEDEGKTN